MEIPPQPPSHGRPYPTHLVPRGGVDCEAVNTVHRTSGGIEGANEGILARLEAWGLPGGRA